MDKDKEKTENEKRVEGAIAGEGAHQDELQVDEKDRQESVAGDIKETKAVSKTSHSTADKK